MLGLGVFSKLCVGALLALPVPGRPLCCLLKGLCPCPGFLVSRRENQLKLSHDWLCYLAPEIVREMTPGKDEDQLPFSKAADVYAFG